MGLSPSIEFSATDLSAVASERRRMQAWGEFGFPSLSRDSKKQGQSGSDEPAPYEALYSCMREGGNGPDEPESPPPFSNQIRATLGEGIINNIGLRAQPALG